jgi:hypothetical protein
VPTPLEQLDGDSHLSQPTAQVTSTFSPAYCSDDEHEGGGGLPSQLTALPGHRSDINYNRPTEFPPLPNTLSSHGWPSAVSTDAYSGSAGNQLPLDLGILDEDSEAFLNRTFSSYLASHSPNKH